MTLTVWKRLKKRFYVGALQTDGHNCGILSIINAREFIMSIVERNWKYEVSKIDQLPKHFGLQADSYDGPRIVDL